MAKVSGILLAYPGLKLQLEGHTDSIGTDEYNHEAVGTARRRGTRLSGLAGRRSHQRTADRAGQGQPVASNDTNAGRQQNRRVEMIVSGDVIGTKIGMESRQLTQPSPLAPQQ